MDMPTMRLYRNASMISDGTITGAILDIQIYQIPQDLGEKSGAGTEKEREEEWQKRRIWDYLSRQVRGQEFLGNDDD